MHMHARSSNLLQITSKFMVFLQKGQNINVVEPLKSGTSVKNYPSRLSVWQITQIGDWGELASQVVGDLGVTPCKCKQHPVVSSGCESR